MNAQPFEAWHQAKRHEHRTEFMRDYEGPTNMAATRYHAWLLAKYAEEHRAADPTPQRMENT